MPANKKANDKPLAGAALIKETCRRSRSQNVNPMTGVAV
jgi:hypothetical protein